MSIVDFIGLSVSIESSSFEASSIAELPVLVVESPRNDEDNDDDTDDDEISSSSNCSHFKKLPSSNNSNTNNSSNRESSSFQSFRIKYILTYTAITLADGLQGTHIYVLYKSYGYNPATLYSLGFLSGAITSPFTGYLIDQIGCKNGALLYCFLEIFINCLEQWDLCEGLILGRVLGGITTNIFYTAFESYLVAQCCDSSDNECDPARECDGSMIGNEKGKDDDELSTVLESNERQNEESVLLTKRNNFSEQQLEHLLVDSTIVASSSSILSGILAHYLAQYFGTVGPFQGAVGMTVVALVLIACLWTDDQGSWNIIGNIKHRNNDDRDARKDAQIENKHNNGESSYSARLIIIRKVALTFRDCVQHTVQEIQTNSIIARIGLIQGLVEGTLETFLFLWAPSLAMFAIKTSNSNELRPRIIIAIGMDEDGEPLYGLIFGLFMLCSVAGSLCVPVARRRMAKSWKEIHSRSHGNGNDGIDDESKKDAGQNEMDEDDIDPVPVNVLCSLLYFICAVLFAIPSLLHQESIYSYPMCLASFLTLQFMSGAYEPLEGIIRSIYIPLAHMCSIVNMLRVVTNLAVALGVFSTTYFSPTVSLRFLSVVMLSASFLQLTLLSESEMSNCCMELVDRLPPYLTIIAARCREWYRNRTKLASSTCGDFSTVYAISMIGAFCSLVYTNGKHII